MDFKMNYKKTITTAILILILLNFSTLITYSNKYTPTNQNNKKETLLTNIAKAQTNTTKPENNESSTIYYELGIITVITITLAALIIYNKRKTKK